MTNERFNTLFGGPPRKPRESGSTQKHMDLAASIQAVTEEAVLRLARSLAKETGEQNLCLAGGVALNCVANGKVLRDGSFENIWIQPAAGDAGGALGAALAIYHLHAQRPRTHRQRRATPCEAPILGRRLTQAEIERRLTAAGARFDDARRGRDARRARRRRWPAARPSAGSRVAWSSDRARSDAVRSSAIRALRSMQKKLNLKVKYRESFRPFAPSVMREDVADCFDINVDSPYMLLVRRSRRNVAAR